MRFCCFESFWLKLTKILSFRSEKWFPYPIEQHTATLRVSVVLKHFNWFDQKTCQLGHKRVFLNKLSYIQLNYAFLLLEAFWRNVTKNLAFRTKKCFSHQIEPHSAKLSISAVFKHFDWYWQKKNLSFRSEKFFSHQIMLHTAKLSIFFVLKHFDWNWQNTCQLGQKRVFLIKLSHILLN